jgi:tetratricopeptide (TPR) repeat protein
MQASKRMKKTWVGLVLTLTLVVACENAGGPQQFGDTPFAPSGFDENGQGVDGLIVGHRLMEAGEYELALKSYLRAAGERGIDADVLSALGSANLKLGRLGQAETLLRQAVDVDGAFVPAWNNLGVTLMLREKFGEAERVFRTAFALDSGESVEIRDNLRLALENLDSPAYGGEDNNGFALVRRGSDDFVLLSTL